MGFRTILIAGLVITSAFFVGQSFGDSFGLLQDASEYNQVFPSNTECDWNQTGTLVNINTNADCELNIDNLSSAYASTDFNRLPYISTEEEFKEYALSTQAIQYNTSTLGDYFTEEEGTNINTELQYYTKEFYSQGTKLQVDYQYEEINAPDTATLVLWDVTNNNQEDSVTLEPGAEADDFHQNTTLAPADDGIYQLRIEIDGVENEDVRFYSVEAWQDSEDLTDVASGLYESDSLYFSDDTNIERIEYLADNIDRGLTNPKQTATIEFLGYKDGALVESETFEAGNNLQGENNVLDGGTTIDVFRFEIELASETSESPKFTSLTVSGTTEDRIASKGVSDNFRILFIMVLIGMAVLYVANELV